MTNRLLDRLSGVFFLFLGGLVIYGALQMPRFEERGTSIYETPGFTPGFLGCALAICGLILIVRPARRDAEGMSFWNEVMGSSITRRRALAAFAMTLGYGAFLFGSVPFLIATFIFVFGFICVFELVLIPSDRPRDAIQVPRVLAVATGLAVFVSYLTRYVFQNLFLVQLP
ncbi:MAG: tripartite tricarboxylate transporter TctB family protein [Hyphomicrobiales bacterium]